jgi:hypothetical protein
VTSSETAIALRLWYWAAMLRVLKRIVPLETLVGFMHRRPSGRGRSQDFERQLEGYIGRTGRFPWRPPSNCLERSLGAYRALCRANADPELVIGVRRNAGRGVEGHVWVMVDGRALGERPEDLASYTAIARFDAAARRHPSGGSAVLSGIPLR